MPHHHPYRVPLIMSLAVLLACLGYSATLLSHFDQEIQAMNRTIDSSEFPVLVNAISQRIDAWFNPVLCGLELLAGTVDWPATLAQAPQHPQWLQEHKAYWAASLHVPALDIADRHRNLVWASWSEDPVYLDPNLDRDAWFFEFWNRSSIPELTFNLYTEGPESGIDLYIDRLLYAKSTTGKREAIGSLGARMPLQDLKKSLPALLERGERVLLINHDGTIHFDMTTLQTSVDTRISTMEGVVSGSTSFLPEQDPEPAPATLDPRTISRIMNLGQLCGSLENSSGRFIYQRLPLQESDMTTLVIMDTSIRIAEKRDALIGNLFFLLVLFLCFVSGILIISILAANSQRLTLMRLSQSESRLSDLLAILSHGIGNELQTLQQGLDGPEPLDRGGIKSRLYGMTHLLQNAIHTSRADSFGELVIKRTFELQWLLQKLQSNFQPMARNKEQILEVTVLPNLCVHNDEDMLYQILANLVLNAIKYSPSGARIVLEASREPRGLALWIKDTGPGFQTQDIPLLFRKYQRLSARPTQGEQSSGLGLYISLQLALACGIRLELCPKANHPPWGTVWKLLLPEPQPCDSGTAAR